MKVFANSPKNDSFCVCVCVCVYQRNSLHTAAKLGELNTVKCFVEEGADINSKDKNGVRMTIKPIKQ